MPRYSVIVPHYDLTISDEHLLRALDCLHTQTFRDFEVILLHDGPPSRPLPVSDQYDLIGDVVITDRRHNDWGHTLRDLGMRRARGDYILHLNPDNVLYPFALADIEEVLREPFDPKMPRKAINDGSIAVFPVLMRGMRCNGRVAWRDKEHTERFLILSGWPALPGCIDCMQMVMLRSLWLSYGGWYDKSQDSDGKMYSRFIQEHGASYVGRILGEHW